MLGSVMDDGVEPAVEDIQLPRVLAALADPHRLAAVRFVARHGESWCAQVIQEAELPMTKPTFSHHLRILREAGVVTKRIQGAKGYMSLRKADLDRRFPGLIDSILAADTDPLLTAAPSPGLPPASARA
jgi:DNA-binding transcriptional ArsR family regulator